MAKDSLIQAFATPVLTRQVDGAAALNGTLAHTIRELARRGPSHDRYRSHQGGFYTPGTLFEQDLPGLAEIQRAMRTGVRTYVDLVAAAGFGRKRAIPDEWILLQGWAALTGAGDYQPPHVHAGSNMSCVYYVEVPAKPEPQGCIDLMNPLTVQEMTFIPGANTTHCRVVPRPGMLLIFPAYVPHTVHPFQRRRRAARRGRERDDPAAMSGAAKERGAVYVATRNPSYVVLAAASARSLRQHAPEIPITLFTNVLEIPAELRRAFDTVTTIPSPKRIGADWANGLIDKIHGIRHTPYERTFFIDADTVVRSRDVAEAFDWLDDYDLLITECAKDASLSRRLMKRPIYSTGILVYRHSAPTSKLIDAWMAYALECIERVRGNRLDEFADLQGLERDQKTFLALTDQYSLARFLSPQVNTHGVCVKVLEERWNFCGDGRRTPPAGVVVDHQLGIKQGTSVVNA